MSNDDYTHQLVNKRSPKLIKPLEIIRHRPTDFSNVKDVQKIYEQQLEVFTVWNHIDVQNIKRLTKENQELKEIIKKLQNEQRKDNK